MLLKDFISSARESLLSLYQYEEAKAIVSRLCEELLGTASYAHILDPSLEIAEDRLPELMSALDRLASGEPLQYVLGYAWFCGRKFKVTPDVLIPRPETEQLCSMLADAAGRGPRIQCDTAFPGREGGLKILDLCTGSGCIAWTLACGIPGSAVQGVDISPKALSVASSQDISLPEGCRRPSFAQYDVLEGADGFPVLDAPADHSKCTGVDRIADDGRFDIIVSNPPYVRESERRSMHMNVLDFEPGLALFVPDSDPLLFYRAVADFAGKRLRKGGLGAVEINEAFGEAVTGIFSENGLTDVCTVEDFRAKTRFVTFRK